MKRLLLIVMTLSLIGCADVDEDGFSSARELDSELTEYFSYYTSATGDTEMNTHHVKFDDLADTKYGICRTHTSSRREWKEVIINPMLWKDLSDLQKVALMLHEFGHCEAGHGHSASYYNIMYPRLQSAWFLKREWTTVMETTYGTPIVSLFAPINDVEIIQH